MITFNRLYLVKRIVLCADRREWIKVFRLEKEIGIHSRQIMTVISVSVFQQAFQRGEINDKNEYNP